ncbi:sigma factor-like helix-turn-helix DNA-binding protein [Sutcliffiella cohnii]
MLNINEILNGNKQKFTYYVELYQDRLYAIAYRMVQDNEEARKLVEGSFEYVYAQLPTYNEDETFTSWFFKITIPHLFNRITYNGSRTEYIPFHSLTFPEQKVLLLHYVLAMDESIIATVLHISIKEVERYLTEAKEKLRGTITANNQGEDCIEIDKLFMYYKQDLSDEEKTITEDHLEFCPACRDILITFEKEDKQLIDFLNQPFLPDSFADKVVEGLKAYTKNNKKRRSWKYQIVTSSILLAVVLLGMLVVPKLSPVYTAVSNYIKHGEMYNVWDEGTYTFTDNDITLEVTGIDISPTNIALHYKVETEKTLGLYGNDSIIDIWENRAVRIKSGDKVQFAEMLMPMFHSGTTKREDTLYFSLKQLDEIPDEFEVSINIRRIAGYPGTWDIQIPVNYVKADKNVETIAINETFMVGDEGKFEITQFEKTEIESKLSLFVEVSEEERLQKEKELEEIAGYNSIDIYYLMPHIEFEVVTENGDPLAGYYNYYEPQVTEDGVLFEYEFMNMFIDRETFEKKGDLKSNEPLFFEFKSIHIIEPEEIAIPITLKEGIYDVNYHFNEFEINTIEIEMDNTMHDIVYPKITLKGKKPLNTEYYIHWNPVDEEDNYLEFHVGGYGYMEGDANSDIVQELELYPDFLKELPETFILKATDVRKSIKPTEQIRIPLYKEVN